MDISYRVDDETVRVAFADDAGLAPGADEVLAARFDDLVAPCGWYADGYVVAPLFSPAEMEAIRGAIADIVKEFLRAHAVGVGGFDLESYHRFVDDAVHAEVIAHTRRLYPKDFGVDVGVIVARLSELIGAPLSFYDPVSDQTQWIICRINRPGSGDFNPVHKDVYESYDRCGRVPQMVNCWIPACGVGGRTGLPIAPGSHLLNEADVVRTKAGSTVNGVRYSVNSVARWNGEAALKTVAPRDGEALVFSSHLIHGLGRNLNADATRISFEFRLYKA